MSEDESTYERTRMMNRYLYGSSQPTLDATNEDPNSNSSSSPNSEQQQNTNGFSTSKSTTHANNMTTPSSDEQRFRSKSHEASSRGLRPGILRVRNKEIERGVRIRNINSMVHSQQDRIVNEKKELNELNHRLDDLVESLKLKKAQNDELQQRLTKMREGIMYGEDEESKYKKAYDQELEKAKRDLNSVSEMSTLSKIRASRSMYDLDRVREMFDDEVRYQNATQEKIRMLENQRAESLHELNYLKENFENKNKSLLDDADRNAKLQQQLNSLSDQLDREQESRVDVECRIQTLLEQKKFDLELYATMRDELERMFLYKGANSIPDPKTFYINELRELKDKIREDFKKQSEFNMETLREEYEYKSTTQIEEIETARRKEREISQEEQLTQAQLNQERQANFEELKRLKETECELTNRLNELSAKLGNYRTNVNFECESRENELWILREQIGNLKNDLSNMLSSSKSLDSEVAVYARLLNQKMNHTVSTTISLQEYENLVFTKHETKVIGTDERERRRNQEQAELKRRQSELEENNRRLKEIEEQRRRQRELEEQRRMKEIEEQHRRQCELLEQQRRQRELEEQRRALELEEQQRRQREFDEQQRRQREIEEQERRLKELEEQRRLREFEEQQRRQRELEEQQRKLREIEEQRRIKECEEQQRRQRECEEQQRRQRDLEEQQRKLRELEEQQRLQREQEEREREAKRQREYEEVQRRQREVEERQRVQREIEEEINRQARQRQHQQVQQCVQQQQQQQIVQQQQQQIVQQQTKIEEHHHHQVIIKKEQRCVNKTTTIAANNDFDAQQKQYIEQQRQQQICQQNKEQMEIERQRRLKMEREEHERYILEKLRQEQELYEIQQRKKIIQEQQEKEKRCQQQQQQQQQHQVQIYRNECKIEPTKVAPVVDVQCVDNIQLYTKRIIEENRKSTEIYEERRVTSSTTNNNGCHHWSTSTSSSNAVPVVPKGVSVIETSQNQARTQSQSEIGGGFSTSSIVDHHLATNNNQKHVIIVNTQKQPNTSSVDCHQQQHHQKSSNNGNQVMRTTVVKTPKNTTNTAVVGAADSAFSNKYAIKHKANRYVSGAIGILETSLNGEYIILENLSSNKVVNLKCWYIHKYVPDQGINVIYKFTDDIHLASGEKLKILARSAQRPHQRSSSVHEGLNKFSTACPNEKILVAHNVENWGTYSKYSVTKLINPDGVDKAVLTQSLLRLASSQSNVTGPAGAVTTVVPPPPPPPPAVDEATQQFINLQHHQQQNADAQRRLKINSKSTTNLNMRNSMHNLVEVDETSCHSAAAAPATHYRISTVAGIQNNQPVLSTTTSTKAGTVSTSTAQESSAASSSSMTTTHQHHHHHHHGNNGFKSQVITSSSTTPRVINNPAVVQSNLTRQF